MLFQVEKMKLVNEVLSSRVNIHEVKLWNITDELNKTWSFVSTIKMQHQKLHTNEQERRKIEKKWQNTEF
jgi:cell division protein FtsB